MTIACRPTTDRERRGIAARVCACTRSKAFATIGVLLAAGLVVVAAPAQAAPGDLDASFSSDGMQTTEFGGWEEGAAVAIQADGKIVAAGSSWVDGSGVDFALARYEPDGSLDASFSGNGTLTTDFGGDSWASGVALQPDGKIVVAGYGAGGFALARYNPDGTLDPSFDGDGKLTTDFGGGRALDVALQADGKIVAVGHAGVGADAGDFALARYDGDGSLDTSFGEDGKVATDFGGTFEATIGVAVQADGKIVAAGRADGLDGEGDLVLARYNADGSLDTSFAGDGRQAMDVGGDDEASDVAIQADGKIVAVGSSYSFVASSTAFVVARYNVEGSLDSSFGTFGGLELTSFAGTDRAYAVAIDPDDRVVAVGDASGDFGLARYHPDGSLDTTFSDDGTQATDFGGGEGEHDEASDVAIHPDGKIVAVGDSVGDFAVARYQGGSAGTAPTNSSPPTISGTATEGETLVVNPGTWSASTPATRGYQWRRCDPTGAGCVDVAGATAATYIVTAGDVGHTIRVRETVTNAYGTGSVDSAATAVVNAKAGIIAGSVRNAKTGAPIASAAVSCATGYSAKTRSDGKYSISNVPPGTYGCTASAKRYAPSTQTVLVASAQTTTANFNLARR